MRIVLPLYNQCCVYGNEYRSISKAMTGLLSRADFVLMFLRPYNSRTLPLGVDQNCNQKHPKSYTKDIGSTPWEHSAGLDYLYGYGISIHMYA